MVIPGNTIIDRRKTARPTPTGDRWTWQDYALAAVITSPWYIVPVAVWAYCWWFA